MDSKEIIHEIREKQSTRLFERSEYSKKLDKACFPYIPVSFTLIDDPKFRNGMMAKPRFRTYLFLRRRVVRGKLQSDPFDVYKNYFLLGELAVCIPFDKLSELLQLPKSTAADHIRQLERDKVIVVDNIPAATTWDNRGHQVFILGRRLEGKESWFLDEVFGIAPKMNGKIGSAQGFKHHPIEPVLTP